MEPSVAQYELFFATFAFVLGAVVGSFLNVCIYRMPLDLSVNEPKRSFCPSCKKQIPWHQNLPLLSWLFLRGKCANCGARIAVSLFRRRVAHRAALSRRLALVPVADRAGLLRLRFAADRRDVHRLRALHHSG